MATAPHDSAPFLIDFAQTSSRIVREARPSLIAKAMFAQSNMRPCYFRHGFDIAVPLRARRLFSGLRNIAPLDRKYFATFKASSPAPIFRKGFEVVGDSRGLVRTRSVPTTARRTHLPAQGTLYLTGNGMSERTAVLDLVQDPAVAEAQPKMNLKAGRSTTVLPSTDDVLVVENCFEYHKEQVRCGCMCRHICSFTRSHALLASYCFTQPGWPCVRGYV